MNPWKFDAPLFAGSNATSLFFGLGTWQFPFAFLQPSFFAFLFVPHQMFLPPQGERFCLLG
jgi:hypothetical protein